MSLPTAFVEGTLVADPELAVGPSGTPWIRFRVACNDRVRDSTGGYTDGPTTFINCVCFGKAAENFVESCAQGDQVYVHGKLEQQEYQSKDGQARTTYRVNADALGPSVRFHPARTDRVVQSTSQPVRDPWA